MILTGPEPTHRYCSELDDYPALYRAAGTISELAAIQERTPGSLLQERLCFASAPGDPLQVTAQAGTTRGKLKGGTPAYAWRSTLELFHRDAVRTRRARFEGRVEVKMEPLVLGESIVRDFQNVDFMIAFEVDNAGGAERYNLVHNEQFTF